MATIQCILIAAASTIFFSQCMLASTVAKNKPRRFSNILPIARDVICQVNGSTICVSTFLSVITKSGSSMEVLKFMYEFSKDSSSLVVFRKSVKCHVVKEMAGESLEGIPEDLKAGKVMMDKEIHLHMLKKLLKCKSDALRRERTPRDVGSVSETAGNSMFTNTMCWTFWRGDGFCDLGCNTEEYQFDDGDCCYDTCISKSRRYPCGYTGFQCKTGLNGPKWREDVKFCFRWRAIGDESQCDHSKRGKLCAPFGSMTKYYDDDTDERNGGCVLSWSIRAETSPAWFQSRLRLCFFAHSDGDRFQCNNGKIHREECKGVNEWINYIDDTDNRPGGCFLRWRFMYMGMLPGWMKNARFCFYWRSNGGQCGTIDETSFHQHHCVSLGRWTMAYRDDTGARKPGCQMAWGILL